MNLDDVTIDDVIVVVLVACLRVMNLDDVTMRHDEVFFLSMCVCVCVRVCVVRSVSTASVCQHSSSQDVGRRLGYHGCFGFKLSGRGRRLGYTKGLV